MYIKDMFDDDINRKVNGVIKVDQDEDSVLYHEVTEYVITNELKKHFMSFFTYYGETFSNPSSDIGVWISGFFGSGKSHFLKMLSYILENKEVNGKKTVEYFRDKFADDPATFMLIDNATKGKTETILFNIDIEGSINKDKTAVLKVFAKMFYNHLGFYGENLKVAMLEKYIAQEGKTEAFRKAFEEKKGKPWVEQRKAFAFNGKAIVPALMEALDLSEEDARNWFNDKSVIEFSIAQLVADIKEYVDSKPDNFRLLFMVDEAGQYVGTDTDMLLNLQSLTEKIGSECGSKVWVMCTGQEAIDEIIKVRADEFSRIQARFKTRLSLTSSSVDEVIQKRILRKKAPVEKELEKLYEKNDSVLGNLFSFKHGDALLDIKGYSGAHEFAVNYPFVPYQFIIMQKVFNEIRKHGNAGKHFSGGERSMLSGFQEAAQKVQNRDEYTLVPLFYFYDTVHTFLDGSIRRVIERCQKAADSDSGIEQYDVDVLKLLYLIRYIDNDIKATIDNIIILMADDIRADKTILREKVRKTLERLLDQNYIGRTGDIYNFLTDEEQDIQKEINATPVDTSNIIDRIGQIIYGDIYTSKKFRYGKYDFAFNQMVDGKTVGAVTGGMVLRFLSVATDTPEKSDLALMARSRGEAIIVLDETPYFDSLKKAMQIRNYVRKLNVPQMPKSTQKIIHAQQDQAKNYEDSAIELISKAIDNAQFYVDGEHLSLKSGDAKSKIDQSLEYLVAHVYSELDLITKNADTDDDIIGILSNNTQLTFDGHAPNQDAAAKIEEYLEMQDIKSLPTSMADIQTRYQAIPYGWREIDIAAVVAQLMVDQKVTIKYAGNTIQPSDSKLPDLLRKKSEIGRTLISKRKSINVSKMKEARDFLRDFLDIMDVPADEDGLVSFIIDKFTAMKTHYEKLLGRYDEKNYPDKQIVKYAIDLYNEILSQKKDNVALVSALINKEDDLYECKDNMHNVEEFFKSQVQIFDAAVKMLDDLNNELDYLSTEDEANKALNRIRLLVVVNTKFNYSSIPELILLMKQVREGHDRLLKKKKAEILENVRQCMEKIHSASADDVRCETVLEKADRFYTQQKQRINELESLALLDGLLPPMVQHMDQALYNIEFMKKPPVEVKPKTEKELKQKKIIKSYNRQIVFPTKRIESEEDLDKYIEQIRSQLKMYMQGCDGIEIK